MTFDEAKKCVKLLGGLFPGQLSQAQAAWLRREFQEAIPYKVATGAIYAFRRSESTLSKDGRDRLPEILRLCKTAVTATANDGARANASFADICRKQNPQLRDRTDFEVILRACRSMWFQCSKSDGYRRKFTTTCERYLVEAGMEVETAASWTETIFHEPDHFQLCLDELRTAPMQEKANQDQHYV